MEGELIDSRAAVVAAQWCPVNGHRFVCWGESETGERLPGTVRVRDLTELDHELAMSGLQTIPTFAIDSVRRDYARDGHVYAGSVVPVAQ